jgi:aldose 1-epimerase
MSDNRISSTFWGKCQGKNVFLFRITDSDGTYVELTNYGASIVSISVPDRSHQMGNVVLGFPTLQGYLLDDCYLGSTIGRYANRIANGKFILEGEEYQLETNDGLHSNHSGSAGFNSKVFDSQILDNGISFRYLSQDGDGGFPGDLLLVVTYYWTKMELLVDYKAETNRKTPVNITNHSYFNLAAGAGTIFEHELTVFADQYLETTSEHIPTGGILSDEAMIFNRTKVGSRLQVEGESLKGLNTCYVLDQSGFPTPAAELFDPASGRSMQVFTSYPGLLLYTGEYLRTEVPGHWGAAYKPFDGLCLECQYFPNAPNHPSFPSSLLEAGEIYHKYISYRFNVKP